MTALEVVVLHSNDAAVNWNTIPQRCSSDIHPHVTKSVLRQELVQSGEFVRLGVALEVRAPRNHDAGAIERTITPSDPPTNLTALRRPKYRQNGKRMPGSELCAMESVCCEGCVGKLGRVKE